MSAFVVSQHHISALVNAAEVYARYERCAFRWHHNDTEYELVHAGGNDDEWTDHNPWGNIHRRTMTPQTLGQALLDECIRSVFHRYEDCETVAELPGYTPDLTERGATYKHNPMVNVRPIVALKAIDCYEYQSCEHPAWESSMAYAFCDSLRRALVRDLPGYEDAPWEIVPDAPKANAVSL